MFDSFQPFGLWQFEEDEPVARKIYNAQTANMAGAFDSDVDSDVQTDIYAASILLGYVSLLQSRSVAEVLPSRMYDTLRTHERDLGIKPRKGQSLGDRQAQVGAALAVPRGSARNKLEHALRLSVGSAFVGIVTRELGTESVVPANENDGIIYRPSGERFALFETLIPQTLLGSSLIPIYLTWGGAPQATDVFLFDPADRTRAEKVTPTSLTRVGTTNTWAFTGTFTKPHDVGCVVTTGPFPMVETSRRHIYVMLTAAAITDPELVRRVNEIMRKTVRGVTAWTVCVENTPGSGVSGPYTYTSPWGLTPFETVTV